MEDERQGKDNENRFSHKFRIIHISMTSIRIVLTNYIMTQRHSYIYNKKYNDIVHGLAWTYQCSRLLRFILHTILIWITRTPPTASLRYTWGESCILIVTGSYYAYGHTWLFFNHEGIHSHIGASRLDHRRYSVLGATNKLFRPNARDPQEHDSTPGRLVSVYPRQATHVLFTKWTRRVRMQSQ